MLKFKAENNQLKYETGSYAEPDGMVEIVYDEDWEGRNNKCAIFKRHPNAEQYIVPLLKGKCYIPYELLKRNKSFEISLKSEDYVTEFFAVPAKAAYFNSKKYIVPQLEQIEKLSQDNAESIEWLEENFTLNAATSEELSSAVAAVSNDITNAVNEIKKGDFTGTTLKAKSLKTDNSIQVPEIKNIFETPYGKNTASIRETENCVGLKYTNEYDNSTTNSEVNITNDEITLKAFHEITIGDGVPSAINIHSSDTSKISSNGNSRIEASRTEVQLKAPSVKIKSNSGQREIADFKEKSIEIRSFYDGEDATARLYLDDDAIIESKVITLFANNDINLFAKTGINFSILGTLNGLYVNDKGAYLNSDETGKIEGYIRTTSLFDIIKTILNLLNFDPANK